MGQKKLIRFEAIKGYENVFEYPVNAKGTWNGFFKNNNPIFIDILSVEKYNEGEFWFGHKQFCENFLNPLILKSKKGIKFNNWFKGNLEGIETKELNNLLNIFDKLSYNIFVHVHLLNKLDKKYISKKSLKPIIKNNKKLYWKIRNDLI